MIDVFFASMVKLGKITIDQVPPILKNAVEAILNKEA